MNYDFDSFPAYVKMLFFIILLLTKIKYKITAKDSIFNTFSLKE